MPGTVLPGDYRIRIKGLHTLRNLRSAISLVEGANTLDMGTLLEGDALNDNQVNGRDVSLLTAAYGKSQGQAGYDLRTDLNEDRTVNDADVRLLQANLGRRGDLLATDGALGLSSDQPLSAKALDTDGVVLKVVPAHAVGAVEQVVILEVQADAGGQPVDALDIHLDYDPAVLQLVDASGMPTTEMEAGTALATVLLNRVDSAYGWVDLVASSLGASPAGGEFIVGRLRLRILKAEPTWVRFSFSNLRTTNVAYRGAPVLGGVEAGHVQAAGQRFLYLPVALKNH
jgi:hypothetical protein